QMGRLSGVIAPTAFRVNELRKGVQMGGNGVHGLAFQSTGNEGEFLPEVYVTNRGFISRAECREMKWRPEPCSQTPAPLAVGASERRKRKIRVTEGVSVR